MATRHAAIAQGAGPVTVKLTVWQDPNVGCAAVAAIFLLIVFGFSFYVCNNWRP